MISSALRSLPSRLSGEVRFGEPLAGYTTYRIGGPAAALVMPRTPDDVIAALTFAAETGTRWIALGLGSNVLVADQGFDGMVIRLGKGLDRIEAGLGGEAWVWRIGAGMPIPQLARRTARAGLAGLHRLIGIPGTVGGGVFMNAGAHGQDFSQIVQSVEVVAADGSAREVTGREVPWRYRSSGLEEVVVLGATVALEPGDPRQLQRDIARHFRWRKAGTPFNEACCGSVFRNPAMSGSTEGKTAGQLIDAAGLKGRRVGGAEVSRKHANYIVNTGGATASDVLGVIELVRERVRREFGVELELEMRVVE